MTNLIKKIRVSFILYACSGLLGTAALASDETTLSAPLAHTLSAPLAQMQSDSIGWGVDWRLQPKQVVVNHNQWRQELGLHSQTDYGTSPWNDKQQAQLGFGFTSLSNHQVQVGAGLNPGEQSRAQLDLNAPALSFYVKYAYEQQLQVRFDWHTQAPLHNHSANMGNHAGVQDAISNVRPSPFFGLSVSYSM